MQKVEEVRITSDGEHRPVVRSKVEVFPVSDSPFVRANVEEAKNHADEKPPAPHHTVSPFEFKR